MKKYFTHLPPAFSSTKILRQSSLMNKNTATVVSQIVLFAVLHTHLPTAGQLYFLQLKKHLIKKS